MPAESALGPWSLVSGLWPGPCWTTRTPGVCATIDDEDDDDDVDAPCTYTALGSIQRPQRLAVALGVVQSVQEL
ncbi:GL15868 [Drosophila persimilis]|uniref:GL15868 n=1 Tax=Drosophila persimilis TaxID=7234 RepID=B4GQ99_DROPE|nr:GL15868 [Drosophila persimilis]